jgi:hypothetical protein
MCVFAVNLIFFFLQVKKEVPVEKVVEKVVEVSTVLLSAGQVT